MKKLLLTLLLLPALALGQMQISKLPAAATPYTGAETFPCNQGSPTLVTSKCTLSSVTAVTAVPGAPQNTATFDQTMALATPYFSLCFGTTNASCQPGDTLISNCTQLAAFFNWWGDSMNPSGWGDTPQGSNGANYNSDLERFQPCNSTNFVFNPSNLTLTGVNENPGAFSQTITTGTSGTLYTLPTAVPLATLGLVSTSAFIGTGSFSGTSLTISSVTQGGLYLGNQISATGCPANTIITGFPAGNTTGSYTVNQSGCTGTSISSQNQPVLGQIVAGMFRGWSYITSINLGTSVTLTAMPGSSSGPYAFNNAINFSAWATDTLAAGITGSGSTLSATLTTPVPAGCQTGMMFAVISGGKVVSNSTSRMTSINTGTGAVTFDNAWTYPGTFASGTQMVCMQPITSAQLWTSQYFLPGATGARWVGFDAYFTIPQDSSGGFNTLTSQCTASVTSAANVASAPANFGWGAFPSFWMYGGNYPVANVYDNSEIDFWTTLYYPGQGPWSDLPGFFGGSVLPAIATINGKWNTATTLSSGTCGTGSNVFWTNLPNQIFLGNSMSASAVRYSAVWTPTQVELFLNNSMLKVENYQWSGQGWAQVGFQMPVGNLAATGRNFAFPQLSTNFPYQLQLTRFRVLKQP